ncbi:DUF3290 domain-containing protein [Lactiplantibacillus mudanjiangensis]|uniref:DUF3290 domain-containing protein n=1 Tax=Lactiplantibacillus mudanjiangensis TaxID=1296538 RepID=A0A660DX99_9LACO|nr:DUF3290 domain-containing protein [Lactiplantibacillus mudanjiangensis]VDG17924.1 hypothetical protein [Lactobacillus pentosus] [Lactiplantibacillus mudanjiangensis]VDG24351.1 hypothetical protein [Lactobacillus pentosus] [Lactiplantibacillus mudanjiangensis]VDG28337.1 hypothetical protein [Lactobacillus pentosus] [Lactiplantibacillus mudanjiangensis]VDG32373.1 hypothetical protein [Lactobacillus pentosus] [Lactiplantibacillus mudanjiangensis]
MTFYAYTYLTNQNSNHLLIQLTVISIIILIIALLSWLWYRHKTDLKYRDLFIIMVLVLLLLVGIQVNEWQTLQSTFSQKSQVTQIMQRVAKDKGVKPSQVWSNTASVNNGMLISVAGHIYNVTINPDGNSYTLTKATPINQPIKYVRE